MTSTTTEAGGIAHQRGAPKWFIALVVIIVMAAIWGAWEYFGVEHLDKYQPVLELISAGKIQGDQQRGRVDLSDHFPGLTPQDELFVTRRTDGSFLVFFPNFYGKGICIAGYLYTSRVLEDADTYVRPLPVALDRRMIDVGSWNKLTVDKKIDDHWYRVSRGMH